MCKMQLAELNESYLSTCHELHKSKEKNLAIAGKMTRSVMCKHLVHMSLVPFLVQAVSVLLLQDTVATVSSTIYACSV